MHISCILQSSDTFPAGNDGLSNKLSNFVAPAELLTPPAPEKLFLVGFSLSVAVPTDRLGKDGAQTPI